VFLWVAYAALLESLGPGLGPDTGLVIALIGAVLLARTTARLHARAPLSWLGALRRAAAALRPSRAPWKLELGLDLRGAPPVPRAWPPVLAAPLVGAVALLAVLAPLAAAFPEALPAIAEISFTLYTLVAGALLAALLAAGAFLALVAILTVRERLRRRPPHAALVVGALVLALAAPLITFFDGPQWLPLLGPLAALMLAAVALGFRGPGEVALLWRPRGRAAVAAVPALSFTAVQLALAAVVALVLSTLAAGQRVVNSAPLASQGREGIAGDEPLVVLPLVGFAFAWCACYGLTALAVVLSRWVRARIAAGRSARARTCVHLHGTRGPAERRAIAAQLGRLGLDVRFAPRSTRPEDVLARLVDHPGVAPSDPFKEERLDEPLELELADLDRPATAARIARRDARLCRARLLAGLAQLMRSARRADGTSGDPAGEGYWVGPQHWFLSGLGRDRQADEDALRDGLFEPRTGVAYADVLDWRARTYFGRIARDLQVDLVFVQDGVRFGGVRRVFETLFETHDVFGGRRRVEERDFAGLVGLRIVLHDFELGAPLRMKGYPEPEYEDLARARILHVFRDRGGRAIEDLIPTDLVDLPQPTLRS